MTQALDHKIQTFTQIMKNLDTTNMSGMERWAIMDPKMFQEVWADAAANPTSESPEHDTRARVELGKNGGRPKVLERT